MKFNVLKSEDIVFYGNDGKKIVNVERIDLATLAHIEGVSPFSVLRLEHNGDTYLLTDEFYIEASVDVLEEFLEEYDEQDEEEYDPQTEEEIEEEELEENEKFIEENQHNIEQVNRVELEENVQNAKNLNNEEQENIDKEFLHFLGKSSSEVLSLYGYVSVVDNDEVQQAELVGEVLPTESEDTLSLTNIEVRIDENYIDVTSITPLESIFLQQSRDVNSGINIDSMPTVSSEPSSVIDVVEEDDDVVVIIDEGDNNEDEGDNNEDEDIVITDEGDDVEEDVVVIDEEIVVVEEPPSAIPTITPYDEALNRLQSSSLEIGDLTLLGVINLIDNSSNIARVNNILDDSDVDIGTDTTTLQNIVDVLIKIDAKDGDSTATDITQSEWQLLGLNNISAPDSNELNIALSNSNSLDLGTSPQTNLQLIVDSLNALDEVKYGNNTGVALSDLTNIGVTGVGGVGEPILEAVNAVLFDADISADHTNSVQEIVDTLDVLNSADGDSTVILTANDIETLGITVPLNVNPSNTISDDELTYINNRLSENSGAESGGDGDFRNDVSELEALVLAVDEHNFYLGDDGANQLPYNVDVLYDGGAGIDSLTVDGGISVDLSNVHNIEGIILNINNSNLDSDLGSALDELTVQDVIDITDGSNVLTIDENDGVANDTVERVYLDNSQFSTDGVLDAEGYYNYIANDGSGVTVRIEELIVVE